MHVTEATFTKQPRNQKLFGFSSNKMEELTEEERIERYLDEMTSMRRFQSEILMDLSVYDLFGNASLDGIEKDIISKVLENYKKNYKHKDSEES